MNTDCKTKQYSHSIYFRQLGQDEEGKPKLIFLHGLLGNGQNWMPVAQHFVKDFEILLIDQRGHGKSKKPESGYHPEDFSKDVIEVMDDLGWDRASFVGHSLGARNCFWLGAHHPDRVDKIVFEDMGPHKTGEASQKTKDMITDVPTPFSSRKEAKDFFEGFSLKYGKILGDYFYSNVQKNESDLYDWRFSFSGVMECIEIGQKHDFWSEYQKVSCSFLILRGEKSEHLPQKVYNKMLLENPRAIGSEISGAGHWVHFDQKDLFVKELGEFLS